MPGIIHVLPDSIANQIAAGEVIQRPASAVKELLENAVDAGANNIKVIVKDAGKGLIQVIDNGNGMTEEDAVLCFERHATSKIKKAKDIFGIGTMGFRGEALASIAAIARVSLKTKIENEDLGSEVEIEGSDLKKQEQVQCAKGTSVAIKNLFYNVPARRNFLKSNPVELRHIMDEFQRVAIAHPHIAFSFFNNDTETFHLKEGSLRQRIVGIFGKNYNQRLVPLEEEASLVKLQGFIGKPEFAKKTRGEQFFFVNNRFIKNGYLHHAVQQAFHDMIPRECHPTYYISLEMDPASIDVNIHPTKTEIKFENDRAIYAILLAAVKQSLGKYNIAPMLDFNQELGFEVPPHRTGTEITPPEISIDPEYNPFKTGGSQREQRNKGNWEELYIPGSAKMGKAQELDTSTLMNSSETGGENKVVQSGLELDTPTSEMGKSSPFQLQNAMIVAQIKSGLVIMHQQYSSERILYEKYLSTLNNSTHLTQQQLHAQTVELSPTDFQVYKEIENEIKALGFNVRDFGKSSLVVEGIPADVSVENASGLLEDILEQYKNNVQDIKMDCRDNLARSLARNAAVKIGIKLDSLEMTNLIDQLFACEMPYFSPYGNPTLTTLTLEELMNKFIKR